MLCGRTIHKTERHAKTMHIGSVYSFGLAAVAELRNHENEAKLEDFVVRRYWS